MQTQIMAQTATTSIFINEHHPRADKKCSISIRVTFNRKKKYYPTRFRLTIDEYERMMGERPRKELKDILLQLQSLEKKAADIIDDLGLSFSFPAFEKLFLENRGLSDTVYRAFEKYIEQLYSEERVGTAVTYACAQESLNRFFVAHNICVQTVEDKKTKSEKRVSFYTFAYVTATTLKKYEKWMLEQDNSPTTIGIYLRSLRTLYNIAINDGMIKKEFYPFGKRKYEIPTSRNTKKALSLTDIAAIFNYQPERGTTEERMRDYWIFLYLCNGINTKDFCRLRFKNLQDDFIVFQRAKSERTKRTIQEIRIPILEEAKAIIQKHGNKAVSPEAYIFPVLYSGIDAVKERKVVQLLVRLMNDHMKVIAGKLGINANLTTYVARHTFSTVLKRSGASMEYISESLGHSSLATTRAYLDSFEDDKKKEVAKALTAFKNVG